MTLHHPILHYFDTQRQNFHVIRDNMKSRAFVESSRKPYTKFWTLDKSKYEVWQLDFKLEIVFFVILASFQHATDLKFVLFFQIFPKKSQNFSILVPWY